MLCVKKYKIVDNKKKRFKSVSLLKKSSKLKMVGQNY